MPNYNLVAQSMFEPFSYERYLQPLAVYGEAYGEQEDALAELEANASVWEGMVNQEHDPVAYQQYMNYSNALQQQVETLASQGLTPSSRKEMLRLRSRYAKDITPIETAYAKRLEMQKMQREARLQDPSLFFERDLLGDAKAGSLDNFLANEGYDYGRTYSGHQLEQDVRQAASYLANTLRTDGDTGEALRNELRMVLPFQYEMLERRGFNEGEIWDAILNNESASPILTNIVEGVLDASGMREWASEDQISQARGNAVRGLWSSLGDTRSAMLTDNWSMQRALQGLPEETPDGSGVPQLPKGLGKLTTEKDKMKMSGRLNNLYEPEKATIDNPFPEGKMKIKKSFMGSDGKTNPMLMYELLEEYKSEALRQLSGVNAKYGVDSKYGMEKQAESIAYNKFEKDFGVDPKTQVMNKKQYKDFQELGFSSNTPAQIFVDTPLDNLIENSVMAFRPSSLNLADYDSPILNNLLFGLNSPTVNTRGHKKDFVTKYDKDKSIKSKKINNNDGKVTNVEYSVLTPDEIIITKGGIRYGVKAALLGDDVANLIKNAVSKTNNPNISLDELGEIQNHVAFLIQAKLQSYTPTRSKTSSNPYKE